MEEIDELVLEINEDVSLALEPAKLAHHGINAKLGLGIRLNEGDEVVQFYLEAEQVSQLREFLDNHFQVQKN